MKTKGEIVKASIIGANREAIMDYQMAAKENNFSQKVVAEASCRRQADSKQERVSSDLHAILQPAIFHHNDTVCYIQNTVIMGNYKDSTTLFSSQSFHYVYHIPAGFAV